MPSPAQPLDSPLPSASPEDPADTARKAAAMGAKGGIGGLAADESSPSGGLRHHDAPLRLGVDSIPAAAPSPYGPGTRGDPQGRTITLDDQSFFLDGEPWMPVVGEFHFARYPADEWRDELLKMKAGGLDTVSSYVFWIHHEEVQGVFDWSGQRSLRRFLQLCQDLGLKAFVRIGPWCHGEVRNGGTPDWARRNSLACAEPFLREQAAQMKGLLWKDGGPVIGIQLDNECPNAAYLLDLKRLAIDCGLDVPFYAVTAWQGGIPDEGVLPLWGGYADGFWGGHPEDYRRFFVPGSQRKPARFPFACVEIGPGMMSGYSKRIKIIPRDVAAMSLAILAGGNGMPGFYMYHGGTNPDGRARSLNENSPHQLPVKDYDFQTALGACGQAREQYHLLREQNLFLQDFGSSLARMPAFFPDPPDRAAGPESLRWTLRTDGNSGFLFYINRQPQVPLPTHAGVRFVLNTPMGALRVPSRPVTIPDGAYGCWPLRLDCDGVMLRHATAQVLCRLRAPEGSWYFLVARDGIPVEIAVDGPVDAVTADSGRPTAWSGGTRVRGIRPGLGRAMSVRGPSGQAVHFVVLTAEEASRVYRVPLAGCERLLLTSATVLADAGTTRLQTTDPARLALAIFPPVRSVSLNGKPCATVPDGIFSRCNTSGLGQPGVEAPSLRLEQPAGPRAFQANGGGDEPWPDPAVYALGIPPAAAGRRLIVSIHYLGDAARLYAGERLVMDHYFNGDPLTFALWRMAPEDWPGLRLQVLPYSEGLDARLPPGARRAIDAAKRDGTLSSIRAEVHEIHDIRLECPHAWGPP